MLLAATCMRSRGVPHSRPPACLVRLIGGDTDQEQGLWTDQGLVKTDSFGDACEAHWAACIVNLCAGMLMLC